MFAHVSHITYKYVLNVYSEHNNRRGNEMYIYAHVCTRSCDFLKWLRWMMVRRAIYNRKSGKAEWL